MSLEKRIDEQEASLSADQILLRWLDETMTFKSRLEYMMWVFQDWRTRHPFSVFFRDLKPLATSKSREKAAERKRLLTAEETLRLGYYLFDGANQIVERQLQYLFPLAGPLLSEVERLENDSLQPMAWMPLPLSEEVAATVRTALDNYCMPVRDFVHQLRLWTNVYCAEAIGKGPSDQAEEKLAKLQEIERALFTGNTPKAGWWVELEPFPYRSLGAASLVDGRWIDRRLLELAEFAALLVSRGYRLQNPPDSHPLEPLLVVNSAGLSMSEQELFAIRKEAESRLRQFKGRKQRIRGKVYVDIDDYRSWIGRAVTGELKRMPGFDVAHWNRWFDSLGGEGRAEIAGVKIHRMEAPFSSKDFVVCEGGNEFAIRSLARRLVQKRIHRTGIGGSAAPTSRSLVRESVSAALIAVLALRSLVKRMEWLFDGHHVIFTETEEQLAQQITIWEEVVDRFNLTCPFAVEEGDRNESGSAGLQIDLDSAAISAEKLSEVTFNTIKLTAEVFALDSLGRHADAMKIVAKVMAEPIAANTDGAQAQPEPKVPAPPGPSIYEEMLANAANWEHKRGKKAKDEEED
jgi:hypothetical protein